MSSSISKSILSQFFFLREDVGYEGGYVESIAFFLESVVVYLVKDSSLTDKSCS